MLYTLCPVLSHNHPLKWETFPLVDKWRNRSPYWLSGLPGVTQLEVVELGSKVCHAICHTSSLPKHCRFWTSLKTLTTFPFLLTLFKNISFPSYYAMILEVRSHIFSFSYYLIYLSKMPHTYKAGPGPGWGKWGTQLGGTI